MADEPLLPHSSEAERVILALMMLSPPAAVEAGTLLDASDFYAERHQAIFRAMLALSERGSDLNPVLLGEELGRAGMLERAGGMLFLSELTTGVHALAGIGGYVAVLKEKALARRGIKLAARLASALAEGDEHPSAAFDAHEAALFEMTKAQAKLSRPRSVADRMEEQARRHELFFRGVSDAVPTGFQDIDDRMTGGGMRPKQFIVLAARPSLGKTSLAMDIAENVAAGGKRVLVFSLEMGAEQLIDRMVAFSAGMERWRIRPMMTDSEYRAVSEGRERVARLPVTIDDSSRTLARILRHSRSEARRVETRPDLIIIDYLQLIASEGRRNSRNDDVGEVSRALKGLANELQLPVLALSQLSRACEQQHREPELSDLRDSGEIEQDADVVWFLFGDKPEEGARFYDRTLKCAKQREGATWRTPMPFNGPLVTFRPLRPAYTPEYTEEVVW